MTCTLHQCYCFLSWKMPLSMALVIVPLPGFLLRLVLMLHTCILGCKTPDIFATRRTLKNTKVALGYKM